MNAIMNIGGIDCYEQDGTAYIKLETVARGLGFTQQKNGVEYVRWETVNKMIDEIGFPNKLGKDDFIPENVFYRLAMKAKNAAAEAFQAKIADEVVPAIRKTGGYRMPMTTEQRIAAALIDATKLLDDYRERNQLLAAENSKLIVDKTVMQPKADYFDELVERNTLTNFRETAKQLMIPPKKFVNWLLDHKYIYRDKKSKLLPYEDKNHGLFEVKECFNEKTQWSGVQTYVTPKGRETFRLLCQGL